MRRLSKSVVAFLIATALISGTAPVRSDQKELVRIAVLLPQLPMLERQLRDELRARGYTDGESVKIDWRRYTNWGAPMRAMAADLIRSAPDLIIVLGTPSARAVLEETKTIPVVFVAGEPVATGLVSSLSHPGGNATGASINALEVGAKLLDLLTQLVPGLRRVVAVRNPSSPLSLGIVEEVRRLAPTMRVQVSVLDAQDVGQLTKGLATIEKHRAGAILIPPDFVFLIEKERVVRAVRNTSLPAIYLEQLYAHAGGLVCYGPDAREYVRIAAGLVEKILKGARPGDLPVEQASKLRLSVNLRTAREMKINIPQPILARADEVIE